MKKILLLAISAVFVAGCAHSTGNVNRAVISGYSDKMANEARVVGNLKVEIVRTITHSTNQPCSTLDFVKYVVEKDKNIHDVLNIRSEETYKYEYTSDNSTQQQRVVLGCDYVGLGVRYVPIENGASTPTETAQDPAFSTAQPESSIE